SPLGRLSVDRAGLARMVPVGSSICPGVHRRTPRRFAIRCLAVHRIAPSPEKRMHVINVILNPAMIGILALFLAVLWMLRDQKDKTRAELVFALVLNLFYGVLLNLLMGQEGSVFPWKFDHLLFRIDASLGIQAAWIARPLVGIWRIPLWIVYQLMVPMMIAWFLLTRYWRSPGSILMAYIAELVSGPLLYTIVPACG